MVVASPRRSGPKNQAIRLPLDIADLLIANYLRAVDRKTAARYEQIAPPRAPGSAWLW